jgi:hypothetical protein
VTDTFLIRPFKIEDTDAVVALWTACGLVYPQNDPRRDIRRKPRVNPCFAHSVVGYERQG